MLANLVFRLKIWVARDNGIPPRSTPVLDRDSVFGDVTGMPGAGGGWRDLHCYNIVDSFC